MWKIQVYILYMRCPSLYVPLFFFIRHTRNLYCRRVDSRSFPRNAFGTFFLLFSVYYYSGADAAAASTRPTSVMRCQTKSHAEIVLSNFAVYRIRHNGHFKGVNGGVLCCWMKEMVKAACFHLVVYIK